MFVSHNQVRMHDTDMAGILYFARQFRFVHDALEDFMEKEGVSFEHIFKENHYAFVIVHAESDYLMPLKVGDKLTVHLSIERVGETSFTLAYSIYRGKELVGTAKTVHVTVDSVTRKKIPIPEGLRESLKKHTAHPRISEK